jgi:hypothetical protein
MITLSYSMMSTFLKCEQMGYWRYVKEYEKKQLVVPFIVGDIYHQAISMLYAKEKVDSVIKKADKLYKDRVQQEREDGNVSSDNEQNLVENKVVVLGMIRGYAEHNKKDIVAMKQVANEHDKIYSIPKFDAQIRVKQDNIIEYKKNWFGHEMKTSKTVNANYVENSQYSFQTALYFHVHNTQYDLPKSKRPVGKKLSAILYDAIQKPSIRRKNGEDEKQFLNRLGKYYTASDASKYFYKETFVPKISAEHVYDTIHGCISKIEMIMKGGSYYKPIKSYSDCAWCDFLSLCHNGGETKQNMVQYKKRRKV